MFAVAWLVSSWVMILVLAEVGQGSDVRIRRSNQNYETVNRFYHHAKSLTELDADIPEHCFGDTTPDTDDPRSDKLRREVEQLNRTSGHLTSEEDYPNRFSNEFLDCAHISINQESYNILPNGSAYVPLYSQLFNDSDYYISEDGLLFICPSFVHETTEYPFHERFSEEFRNCSHISIEQGCYHILANGSAYAPLYSQLYNHSDYYISEDGDLYVCPPFFNETVDEGFYDRFSKEFLNCTHISIKQGCYDLLPNGSVYVPLYSKVFNDSDFYIPEDGDLYLCPSFYKNDNQKFSNILNIVSIVCTGISTLCIIMHMLMFGLLREMRNLPGCCMFSLCSALLIAYICIFGPFFLNEESDCSSVGMVIYYFFLVAFFWMNVISYDVWRALRLATAKLRLTADKPMLVRFALYSLYSWGVPFAVAMVALIVDSVTTDEFYKLRFNKRTCWFEYRQALMVYFGIPFFVLLCVNVLFYLSSSFMIASATMRKSENRDVLWSRFFISIRLAVVMGLTWAFGAVAAATKIEAFAYINVILNALQGLLIFFSVTFTGKIKKAWRRTINQRKISMMPFTSQQTSSC